MSDPDNPLLQYESYNDEHEYQLWMTLTGEDRQAIRKAKEELATKYGYTREAFDQFNQAVRQVRG